MKLKNDGNSHYAHCGRGGGKRDSNGQDSRIPSLKEHKWTVRTVLRWEVNYHVLLFITQTYVSSTGHDILLVGEELYIELKKNITQQVVGFHFLYFTLLISFPSFLLNLFYKPGIPPCIVKVYLLYIRKIPKNQVQLHHIPNSGTGSAMNHRTQYFSSTDTVYGIDYALELTSIGKRWMITLLLR